MLAHEIKEHVIINEETGCWEWQEYINEDGYGRVWSSEQKKKVYVHRWTYELANGMIDAGMTVDHTCCKRTCCNPEHLQQVTLEENVRLAHERRQIAYLALMALKSGGSYSKEAGYYNAKVMQTHKQAA